MVAYLQPIGRPEIARIRGVSLGRRRRGPARARADRGGRPRRRPRRARPVPHDDDLRAHLRARGGARGPSPSRAPGRARRRRAAPAPARGRRRARLRAGSGDERCLVSAMSCRSRDQTARCPSGDQFAAASLIRSAMSAEAQRLNRYLAACGLGSRRGVETLVAEGRVTIDGVVATSPGQRVPEGARVTLDGRPVAPDDARLRAPAQARRRRHDRARHARAAHRDRPRRRRPAALPDRAGSTPTRPACSCSRTTATWPPA